MNDSTGKRHMVLVAIRDIMPGEPILYYYGEKYHTLETKGAVHPSLQGIPPMEMLKIATQKLKDTPVCKEAVRVKKRKIEQLDSNIHTMEQERARLKRLIKGR